MKTRIVIVSIIFCLLFGTGWHMSSQRVNAENMQSDSYVIQFGNFNVTAGEKSGPTYKVTDTVGQTGAGPYGTFGVSNYFIGSGFQYIYQIPEFEFSISATSIDLGMLVIGTHSSQSHTMSITTKGAGGYAVYVISEHPLRHQSASTDIPYTTCDAGTCTINQAQVWNNQAIPGFGYHMSGDNVPADFVGSTYFRPFPDREAAENAQAVMVSYDVGIDDTATITYKAGIDANQAAGRYATAVNFIAVPSF